ncbi:hypothetical protein GHT09_004887 [Marmota monax]|uniref:Uncharacterized protein n=1 Tax=Marmota monax TaxID=9995 RepID=A0A834V6V1_MARMO|nr:hypothetical protein GHT09_004887 [Marmota monax]
MSSTDVEQERGCAGPRARAKQVTAAAPGPASCSKTSAESPAQHPSRKDQWLKDLWRDQQPLLTESTCTRSDSAFLLEKQLAPLLEGHGSSFEP